MGITNYSTSNDSIWPEYLKKPDFVPTAYVLKRVGLGHDPNPFRTDG